MIEPLNRMPSFIELQTFEFGKYHSADETETCPCEKYKDLPSRPRSRPRTELSRTRQYPSRRRTQKLSLRTRQELTLVFSLLNFEWFFAQNVNESFHPGPPIWSLSFTKYGMSTVVLLIA